MKMSENVVALLSLMIILVHTQKADNNTKECYGVIDRHTHTHIV